MEEGGAYGEKKGIKRTKMKKKSTSVDKFELHSLFVIRKSQIPL